MRRVLLAAVVAAGLLVLTPTPSWACSCAARTTAQQVRSAVTVAAGTVDWTTTDGQTRTYQVDFDAVYKGAAASSEKLRTGANEASCGLANLAPDERYLFFIEGQHLGEMTIGLCGGTTSYDEALAAEVQAITGPPEEPLAVREQVEEKSDRGPWLLLGGVALLAAVGAAAVVLGRRGTSTRDVVRRGRPDDRDA